MTFHANGKLLLTGEYFILDGAKGLALPTRFGQTLTVESSTEKGISWKSLDNENKIWFEAQFSETLDIVFASDLSKAEIIQSILKHCSLTTYSLRLTTKLDFPKDWGLGSSSTLMSLLAQWTGSNPYELVEKTFGGSGYDIACATAKSAIQYQLTSDGKRIITPVNFYPAFSEHLYFIYLNQKQNSREGIQHYRKLSGDKTDSIVQLTSLTEKIVHAVELDEFCYYLDVHENIIAQTLQLKKAKDIYFSDFPGSIKSLGAWGGDFVLAVSDESPEMIRQYFTDKGFPTILTFEEMILT